MARGIITAAPVGAAREGRVPGLPWGEVAGTASASRRGAALRSGHGPAFGSLGQLQEKK